MLTGDSRATAERIAAQTGIDEVIADLVLMHSGTLAVASANVICRGTRRKGTAESIDPS